MKLTAWNCRGLGNGPAVRGLLDFQKQVDPNVLFLSETKMDGKRMEKLKWMLGMSNMVLKDCYGKSGGLAMLWKKEINLELHNYSRYHIDVVVIERDGFKWRFTGLYGEPSKEKRWKTWKLLRILKEQLSLTWLCAGDFNEILYNHEKRGGPARAQNQMDNFRMALDDCELRDLGFVGDKFTWRNHSHTASNYIKERLDRAVASRTWCMRFPTYKVLNGDPYHSDHRPVTILMGGSYKTTARGGRGHTFRFEAKWLQEEDCEVVIKNAWDTSTLRGESCITEKLKTVAHNLQDWDTNILGDLPKRIKDLKTELEKSRRGKINQKTVSREHFLRDKLERLEHQWNTFWRQRAHVKWLQEGDKNTAFFHAFASERKKKNTLKGLKTEDGRWIEGNEPLKDYIANYFSDIFSSTARHDNEAILRTVQPKVTEEMNEILCAEYTEEEVKAALDNIGDLKAPRPDGMPAIFFKRFWQTVGEQVTREVLNVLKGGQMPENWNATLVVLIPKNVKPEKIKDLRPISLCNVIYKLISKRRRKGSVGYAALKLDMSKAYDRIEWSFLRDMMHKLGFNRSWIQTVMKCITTVRYQIKVNGEVTNVIVPQRGLRQGDPLSPYLFLLCVEGFSAMLYDAEHNGRLKGIKICSGAPSISHLLFADDSLLLMEANASNAHEINHILDKRSIKRNHQSYIARTLNLGRKRK